YSAPLVSNEFEAWEFGPVVRVVYEAFRGHKRQPIRQRALRLDPVTGVRAIVHYNLTEDDVRFVSEIFNLYSQIDPLKLSEMTHLPGSPWDQVWRAPKGTATLGMIIKKHDIKAYF